MIVNDEGRLSCETINYELLEFVVIVAICRILMTLYYFLSGKEKTVFAAFTRSLFKDAILIVIVLVGGIILKLVCLTE
jgi:heme/copper-type cytochrome/quinol oxidase subunit 4